MSYAPGHAASPHARTSRVEGTREAILGILRRRDGVSVDQFARELGLAGATVRRHLDVLLRDGFVSVSQVRGGAGRPRYSFSLTEAGADAFPHHYVRLTQRLLEEIVALAPEETAGRHGRELAELVFSKLAERLASECAPRVSGRTLEERARSAVALLAEEGIDFEVELHQPAGEAVDSIGELRVLGRGCPCRRVEVGPGLRRGAPARNGAGPSPDAGTRASGVECAHDRILLGRLLGARVEPLPGDALPHDFLCGYALQEEVGAASSTNAD
jgi:predicted ArsR family transcriptional regulator